MIDPMQRSFDRGGRGGDRDSILVQERNGNSIDSGFAGILHMVVVLVVPNRVANGGMGLREQEVVRRIIGYRGSAGWAVMRDYGNLCVTDMGARSVRLSPK